MLKFVNITIWSLDADAHPFMTFHPYFPSNSVTIFCMLVSR